MAAHTMNGLHGTYTSGSPAAPAARQHAQPGLGEMHNSASPAVAGAPRANARVTPFPGGPNARDAMPPAGSGMGAVLLEKSLGQLGAGEDAAVSAANAAMTGPLLLGVATSAAGGAVVGGLAAGSWKGAAIGAGLNAAIWSLLTLGGAWASATGTTKAILGGAAILGGGASGYMIYKRMKK